MIPAFMRVVLALTGLLFAGGGGLFLYLGYCMIRIAVTE